MKYLRKNFSKLFFVSSMALYSSFGLAAIPKVMFEAISPEYMFHVEPIHIDVGNTEAEIANLGPAEARISLKLKLNKNHLKVEVSNPRLEGSRLKFSIHGQLIAQDSVIRKKWSIHTPAIHTPEVKLFGKVIVPQVNIPAVDKDFEDDLVSYSNLEVEVLPNMNQEIQIPLAQTKLKFSIFNANRDGVKLNFDPESVRALIAQSLRGPLLDALSEGKIGVKTNITSSIFQDEIRSLVESAIRKGVASSSGRILEAFEKESVKDIFLSPSQFRSELAQYLPPQVDFTFHLREKSQQEDSNSGILELDESGVDALVNSIASHLSAPETGFNFPIFQEPVPAKQVGAILGELVNFKTEIKNPKRVGVSVQTQPRLKTSWSQEEDSPSWEVEATLNGFVQDDAQKEIFRPFRAKLGFDIAESRLSIGFLRGVNSEGSSASSSNQDSLLPSRTFSSRFAGQLEDYANHGIETKLEEYRLKGLDILDISGILNASGKRNLKGSFRITDLNKLLQ